VANNSVFIPAPQVWAKFWVHGDRAIERHHYSVMPSKESIDHTIDQLQREYEAVNNA
jgi:hypothetical protein